MRYYSRRTKPQLLIAGDELTLVLDKSEQKMCNNFRIFLVCGITLSHKVKDAKVPHTLGFLFNRHILQNYSRLGRSPKVNIWELL